MDRQRPFLFSASGRDPVFETLRLSPDLQGNREAIERMWDLFQPFADSDFLSKARDHDFFACFWELYLGCSLLHQGIQIKLRKERTHAKGGSNKGPDFEITSPFHGWIEAVTPGPGNADDAIPAPQLGIARSVPDDETKLRILGAIRDKERKRRSYVNDGLVSAGECYVVAINLAKFPFVPDDEPPRMVRAVLGLGYRQVAVAVESGVMRDDGFQLQEAIVRHPSGSPVSTLILSPASPDSVEYVGISALLSSGMSPFNGVEPWFNRARYMQGDDYCILHNPQASTHLPTGFLQLGREYWLEGGVLKRQDWCKRPKTD